MAAPTRSRTRVPKKVLEPLDRLVRAYEAWLDDNEPEADMDLITEVCEFCRLVRDELRLLDVR